MPFGSTRMIPKKKQRAYVPRYVFGNFASLKKNPCKHNKQAHDCVFAMLWRRVEFQIIGIGITIGINTAAPSVASFRLFKLGLDPDWWCHEIKHVWRQNIDTYISISNDEKRLNIGNY